MLNRDCSGYGVYEGVGVSLPSFLTPPPAPSSLAVRLGALAPPAPGALVLSAGQAAAPKLFFPLPLSRPSMAVMPFVMRPLRPNFRLVLQPVRRRVQVPIPIPRTAPSKALTAGSTLVAVPTGSVVPSFTLPGQQVMTTTLPGIPSLPGMPTIGFTQHGNLWIVDPTQLSAVSAILGTMSYTLYDVPDVDSVGAHAEFVLGQIPAGTDAWSQIQLHASQGFVTMVEKASVATGTLNLVVTQSPTTIAQLAGGPNATHALVLDQPTTLVDQADASLNPAPPAPGQPETGTCPGGTTGTPPDCAPYPMGDKGVLAAQAAAAPAPSGSWWSKLSTTDKYIGVGAVGLVAVALAMRASSAKKR